MAKPGTVFLVGAGPGDPGLLTQKAAELMKHCDVVCYDLLVGEAILAQIPKDKTLIPVGYRGYCGTSIEYGMHPEVIDAALAGNQVLRLKAGDPFIFGRATEECLCLQHFGIDYQVVPGISASLGAAAYAGFPLTSNGMASDVTFASGHRTTKTICNWAALGQSSGTLVLYMGAKKLAGHAEILMQEGKSGDTPVAIISAATSAHQRMLSSTLATVGKQVTEFDNGDPMLVVIGDVVTLAPKLDWRSLLPLSNTQILASGDNSWLADKLKLAGAIVAYPFGTKLNQCFSQQAWTSLLNQKELHLADISSAKALLNSARKYQLDSRNWRWQLTACSQAQSWLAERAIICPAEPSQNAIRLHQHSNGLQTERHLQVPSYPLRATSIALIDDIEALQYLHDNALLSDDAQLLTTSTHMQSLIQQQGLDASVISNNEQFLLWLSRQTRTEQAA
ncbi:uroporphyrinogen-III C-methyltransferase [Shewanella sp. TC10]|uniref:uroporphyrinogen-III C-methyltransferase n=1 Tax=Shewanella sp. TC10 TaxID=1419739 RepID=UPI0018928925|nr:uroporphyrinogen-III C-methyltransferase [Shewanella sp. TC10]